MSIRTPSAKENEAFENYWEAGADLFLELANIGCFVVESLQELSQLEFGDKEITVLAKSLKDISYKSLYSDVASSLASKKARIALPILLKEFIRKEDLARWEVGNAISEMMQDCDFEAIRPIVLNREFRHARQMLVMKLSKLKKTPEVIPLLIELLQDKDVAMHAIIALGKLKAVEARQYIEPFLELSFLDEFLGKYVSVDVKKGLIKEAKKAIKKINQVSTI